MGASKDELKRWAQEQDCKRYCFGEKEAAPLPKPPRHRLPDADEFEPADTPSFRHPSLNRHGR